MNDLPDLHCIAPAKAPRKLNPQHSENERFVLQDFCASRRVIYSSSGSAFRQAISESCPNSSAVGRAFQLAKAGQCASINDIMRKLKSEGYSVERLVGSSLIKQLSAMIFASRR